MRKLLTIVMHSVQSLAYVQASPLIAVLTISLTNIVSVTTFCKECANYVHVVDSMASVLFFLFVAVVFY